MKRLIVNADDFGLTKGVSQGIIDAHSDGIVTSTSLMANGNAFEESVALARKYPNLGMGAHLNLTQGKPVAPLSRVRSLVNSDGRLRLSPYSLWSAMLTRKIRISEIEAELRAQIEKILMADVSLTHLDGHKHVHILPRISEVVIRLAQEYGIRSIRRPIEEGPGVTIILQSGRDSKTGIVKQYLMSYPIARFAHHLNRLLMQAGLHCPAHFYGFTVTGFLSVETLAAILVGLPEGTSELMCHPGYFDPALMDAETRLLAEREEELETLTSFEIKELVKRQQIQLVTYRDLTEAAEAA